MTRRTALGMTKNRPEGKADDAARKAVRRVRGLSEVRMISFGAAAVAVVAILLAAPAWLTGVSRIVAAYDAGALVLLALLWSLAMHVSPDLTRARAAREDPGRNIVFFVVILSGLVGLASAVSILGLGPHLMKQNEKLFAIALAIVAVIAGWFLIHTTFTFRYAHLYYFDGDGDRRGDGGLKFPGTREPGDYDFAYFSFILGMTFQVSDVEILDPGLRRLALGHGLISFAYNTAIIALVVNIASSLLHS